jgi:hypothetical protein
MNVNIWDVADAIAALIRAGKTIDVEQLTDPRTSLDALVDR